MEIQYFGANCVRLTTKKATIVVDDNLKSFDKKSVAKAGDICLYTNEIFESPDGAKIVISGPGEYEVSDVSVAGVSSRAHIDESGNNATMYKIVAEDIRVAVLGHVHPDVTEAELEKLGTIDVLILPVGGNGFTLDPVGALKLIKEIEPKIVIPTHYAIKGINHEVPQQELEEALKVLSIEHHEPEAKLKLKAGELGELIRVVTLEVQ